VDQGDSWEAQPDQPGHGPERRRDHCDQRDPLDGSLSRFASATLGEATERGVTGRARFLKTHSPDRAEARARVAAVADDVQPRSSHRRSTRFYIWVAVIILTGIFIFQNSQEVEVKFFFSTTHLPLIWGLLLAAVLGFGIGLALPRFLRRRD
jgi:uncharacterized integral membrane protein